MPTFDFTILTKKFLHKKYVVENKSLREIANELGCSTEPIRQRLRKHNFTMKTAKSHLTGKKISEERRLKMIKNSSSRGKVREHSHAWKSDDACYEAIHIDIRKIFSQPENCQECGIKNEFLDLANISGEYKREISDWEWLCRKCHMTKDGRLEKFMLCKYKFNNNDKQNILDLKEKGYKLVQIAKLYNTNYQNIQRILKTNYNIKGI